MRQIAITFTALAFLAVPAAATKCKDAGTCPSKSTVAVQTAPPVEQPADNGAGPAAHQENGLQTAPPVVQPANTSTDSVVRQATVLQTTPQVTQPTGQSYRIGAQDVLEILVFQAPELTQTVQVGPTGQINLPLIGAVQAGGRTGPEVEAEIATRLRVKYLKNPQVNVYIKEFNSQKITVEGAVKKPGIYPITGQMSLLQAVALSGGFDDVASSRNVSIFRTTGGRATTAKFDVRKIKAGRAPDPSIQSGDIISVGESAGKKGLNGLLKTLPIIGLFGL